MAKSTRSSNNERKALQDNRYHHIDDGGRLENGEPVKPVEAARDFGPGGQRRDSVMMHMWGRVRNRLRREDGATMVEYGLVVTLIALVALLSVAALGERALSLFELVTF
jgi:Flp pilus assembly pilin Flp